MWIWTALFIELCDPIVPNFCIKKIACYETRLKLSLQEADPQQSSGFLGVSIKIQTKIKILLFSVKKREKSKKKNYKVFLRNLWVATNILTFTGGNMFYLKICVVCNSLKMVLKNGAEKQQTNSLYFFFKTAFFYKGVYLGNNFNMFLVKTKRWDLNY